MNIRIQKKYKAYFSDLDKNYNDINEYNKTNCEIEFEKNSISFLSDKGESFNISFKQEVIDIYPILNGIIVKIKEPNSDFAFFKEEKEREIQYNFFFLIKHPLFNLIPLNNNNDFDIIYSSLQYPFILIKENNKLKLNIIMFNNNFDVKSFKEGIEKILYSDYSEIKLNDNKLYQDDKENFYYEYKLKLINVYSFDYIDLNNIQKIKIYKIASKKSYLYISLKIKNTLIIYQIKFDKNFGAEKVSEHQFNNIIDFHIINSLINDKNYILYDFTKNKNYNENVNSINYWMKNNNINNKTLVYLEKGNNTLYFLEGVNLLFKYKFEVNFEINEFNVKNEVEYFIKNNEKNMEAQINLNFSLKQKDVIINYLKFFKYEFGSEFYYSLLSILFSYIIYDINNNNLNNHSTILNLIIFSSFKKCFGSSINEIKYKNLYNDKNLDYKINEINFNNNILNLLLNKGKTQTINTFSYFLKGLYENRKAYNFNDESISNKNIINLLFNILFILDDNYILFQYLMFFNNNYNIPFISNIKMNYNPSLDNIYQNENSLKLIPYLENLNLNKTEKYIFNHISNISDILNNINESKINFYNYMNTKYIKSNIIEFSNKKEQKNEFFIFDRVELNNNIYNNDGNFLIKLVKSNYDTNNINLFAMKPSIILLNSILKAKENPYYFINNQSKKNKLLILNLLDRKDIIKKNLIEEKEKKNDGIENITSMFYNNSNINSNYDKEYYLLKIKFKEDNRIEEVKRILNPTRILKVESNHLKRITDLQQLETEKFILVYKNLLKQYTSCIGNGAFNLNTIKTFPKDVLSIQPLNEEILLTSEETIYKFDKSNEILMEKDFSNWAEFHNGVSQSLKLCSENYSDKSYIRNWILFNKPQKETYEHGGFLLGMGLLKQLDSLYATDVYQYMKPTHEGTTIGILLGKSASKLSSMEETLSRTLCLHISFLIPQSLEINIPMNIQCSAVIGIGLIYLKSENKLMTEMLLNQVGKISNNNDKGFDLKHLSSYNLSLGFSVGLINLGKGKITNNNEHVYEDKIFSLIYPNTNNSNISKIEINKNSSLNGNNKIKINNEFINKNQTTPAGYCCLTLSYLKTKNKYVVQKLKFPENLYQLNSFKPFHLYLSLLCKNLILWDNITPSNKWVESNIQEFIKFLYEKNLAEINQDITYSSQIYSIDFSQISTSYYYSLVAGLMSLGFKHCGTNDIQIAKIIIYYIKNALLKVRITNDIIIRENIKYDDKNKKSISKKNRDECLCIASYALSLIMSGSGDLDSLKLLKIVRKKISESSTTSNENKNLYVGFMSCINHAIGMLFLGNGGLIFNNSLNSLAFLYISTFPVFNKTLNDNENYLQPLRHLYVLACQNKIFEARDIDTDEILQTKINIEYLNGNIIESYTPLNLNNFDYIKKIVMKNNKDYYQMEINREDINFKYWNEKENLMKTKVAYIKKKKIKDNSLSLIINEIDINNNKLAIEKIKEAIKYLSETDNYLKNICIDEINYVLENLKIENNFDIIYIKLKLLLMNEFVNKENNLLYLKFNDYLNKVRNEIHKGICNNFKIFNFFINQINEIIYFYPDNIGLKCIIIDVKNFILNGLNAQYKNNLVFYINNIILNKINIEFIDWNLFNYIHLFNINYFDFNKIIIYLYQNRNNANLLSELIKIPELNKLINDNNFDFILYVQKLIKDLE